MSANSCKLGLEKFRLMHPELDWSISCGREWGELILTIVIPGKRNRKVPVFPTLDMAEGIFTTLEQVLSSQ